MEPSEMKLKPDLVERIQRELGFFGLEKCALSIIEFIGSSPAQGFFYISLSDIIKSTNSCSKSDAEKVVNYLATTSPPTLIQTYCFLDDDAIFHELNSEALITYQETRKLYHPSSGKLLKSDNAHIFLLYKTESGLVRAS